MLYKISILKNSTTLTLFAMGEGGGGGGRGTLCPQKIVLFVVRASAILRT